MKATPMIFAVSLLLSGCGGCHHETASSRSGGAAGAPAAAPAAQHEAESGKIRVAPPEANAPAHETAGAHAAAGGNVPTPANPAAPGGAAEGTGQPEDEGDCIVVADANPDYGPPPLNVSFSSEAECSGGEPTYKWDFGDGSAPSADTNPSHTYTKAGEYTASVTVTSAGATASDEIDITVEEGEPQAESQ
jgi:hypothetical protein